MNDWLELMPIGGFSPEHTEILQRNMLLLEQDSKSQDLHIFSEKLFDRGASIWTFGKELSLHAKEYAIPEQLFYLLFFLRNLPKLKILYEEKGLEEELFTDLLKDFKLKNDSCLELHGHCGVTSIDWYAHFYRMKRFALGRFHYDVVEFNHDGYTKHGITLRRDDKVVTVHIPMGCKITKEVRFDSYQKAYRFFQKQGAFDDGILKLVCHSWIFYGPYKNLYPKTSNLYDFTEDFTLLYNEEQDSFRDGWRIFGPQYKGNVDDLPQNTSLQKAFAEYMKHNNRFGVGYVLLLFDGEKILK